MEDRQLVNGEDRVGYIDIFRSFGILLMVMGHIGFGEKFDVFIHAFHMPMFFWVSGYFYRRRPELCFQQLAVKKAKALLIPYFVFGIAHYCLWVCFKGFALKPLINLFSVNTDGLAVCGALWFLTALFFTDIIFFLIDTYLESRSGKILAAGLLALFGNIAGTLLPFTLPFALGASFVGVGLYGLGYLCRAYGEGRVMHTLMNLSWFPNSILAFAAVLLIFANGPVNMRTGAYACIPLFWVNALLAAIVGMNYGRLLYAAVGGTFIGRWLTGIGRDSIVYVCLNQVVIFAVTACLGFVPLPAAASKIAALALSLGILYLAGQVVTLPGLRIVIGRSSK